MTVLHNGFIFNGERRGWRGESEASRDEGRTCRCLTRSGTREWVSRMSPLPFLTAVADVVPHPCTVLALQAEFPSQRFSKCNRRTSITGEQTMARAGPGQGQESGASSGLPCEWQKPRTWSIFCFSGAFGTISWNNKINKLIKKNQY